MCLLLLFSSEQTKAQGVRQVTFNQAVKIGLEQNVTLKKAANDVELQSIVVSRQMMNFYPDLSISSNASQNYGRNFDMINGEIVSNTIEYAGVNAATNINLFNGFSDVASLKQSQLQLNASEMSFERARQTLAFQVMQNFLTTISRREQIQVQEQNLEAQQKQLERIRAFTEVGERPISDLYQQEAETANAELNLVNAQRAYQIAEAGLIQHLQLDPFAQYEFVAPSIDDVQLIPQQYRLEQMLKEALGQRKDLRASETNISAARQAIKAARGGWLPRIDFSAGYGTDYSTNMPFKFADQLDQNRGGSVGFNLRLPLFDRFATRQNTQQAQVLLDNARLNLSELQQTIAVQIRQAYLDYILSEKTLEVTEKQLQSATKALEAAQARYDVQAATLVEVTQANAIYVKAVTDRVNARYDLLFRHKLIDYYLGTLDPARSLFE